LQHTGLKSIIRNASYLIGGQGINIIARAIYAIALSRYLGPELYGLFNYGLSWYLILLPATILGLDVLMSREIGKNHTKGIETISHVFSVRLIITTLISTLSILTVWLVETNIDVKVLITILTFALFGRSIYVWAKGTLTAIESTKHAFKLDAIIRPGEVLIGILILIAGGGVIELALAHTISWWIQGLLSLRIIRYLEPNIKLKYNSKIIISILRQSIPLGIVSILIIWFVQGPIIMFRSIEGFTPELGQVTLIIQIFIMFSSIPNSIGNAAMPVLTRALIRQDGKAEIFIDGMMRISIVLGGFVSIFLISQGDQLVTLVFGEQYISAGQLLGFMTLILIPYSCANTISRFHMAEGKYTPVAKATIYGALLFTLTYYPSVYFFGLFGIIVSMGAGLVILNILLIKLHIKSYVLDTGTTVYRPLLLSLVSLASYQLFSTYNEIGALMIAILTMFTGVFLLKIIRKNELELILKVRHKQ
jgi:O-antigen/teichoic acid export membrane protein